MNRTKNAIFILNFVIDKCNSLKTLVYSNEKHKTYLYYYVVQDRINY